MGSEPEEASALPLILCKPAEALLIEEAELGLCGRISLIGGAPENSRCRPLDLRKPAAAGVLGRVLRRKAVAPRGALGRCRLVASTRKD